MGGMSFVMVAHACCIYSLFSSIFITSSFPNGAVTCLRNFWLYGEAPRYTLPPIMVCPTGMAVCYRDDGANDDLAPADGIPQGAPRGLRPLGAVERYDDLVAISGYITFPLYHGCVIFGRS